MALTAYLTATRRLLHDANSKTFTDAELTSYVNSSRKRVALDTGSISGLVAFNLCQGQESYPYSGAVANLTVTNAGGGYASSPTVSFAGGGGTGVSATVSIASGTVSAITLTSTGSGFTAAPAVTLTGGGPSTTATVTASIMQALDILSISVNYQNSYITLGYEVFSKFQAVARYWRTMQGMPSIWTMGPPAGVGGGRAFYIYQIPSQAYPADVHCITTPSDLVDDTTPEPLTYPESDLVPYYAAFLAKYNEQEFQESEKYLMQYDNLKARGAAGQFQRRIKNPYA